MSVQDSTYLLFIFFAYFVQLSSKAMGIDNVDGNEWFKKLVHLYTLITLMECFEGKYAVSGAHYEN